MNEFFLDNFFQLFTQFVRLYFKTVIKVISYKPAVVVERSNALVYLMISSLELKVEGSNPAISRSFLSGELVGLECACAQPRSSV